MFKPSVDVTRWLACQLLKFITDVLGPSFHYDKPGGLVYYTGVLVSTLVTCVGDTVSFRADTRVFTGERTSLGIPPATVIKLVCSRV